MTNQQLFAAALNISLPWYIKALNFDESNQRLDIEIDFVTGSTFSYTEDDGTSWEGKAYDTVRKSWRHLNFFQHECYLNARVPRIKSGTGKINRVIPPWEGKMNGFTLLFEAMLMQLISVMPVLKVQKMTNVNDDKLWSMLERYVSEALGSMDLSELKELGLDETSLKKGHKYISIFVDLLKRKVVFVTEGKDSSVLSQFAEFLKDHNGKVENIKETSIDMSAAFIKGVHQTLPEANINFDKFHLIQSLNKAVDLVRRQEVAKHQELKGARYSLLKNPQNLTKYQRKKLDDIKLSKKNIQSLKAYNIRLSFQEIINIKGVEEFEEQFKKWYFWATHSRIDPIIKVAKSFKKHYDGIVSLVRSGLNNGILEGINSIVKATKAKARGYKKSNNLIAIIYLMLGDIDISEINKDYSSI